MATDMAQIRRCRHPKGRCNCDPSFRVNVWDPRTRTPHRKTLRTYPEARTWRDDVRVAIRNATIR